MRGICSKIPFGWFGSSWFVSRFPHELPLGCACGTFAVGVGQVGDEDHLAGLGLRVDLDPLHERLDQLAVLEINARLRNQSVEAGELGQCPAS